MTTRRAFIRSLPILGTAALVACRKRTVSRRAGREEKGSSAEVYRALNGHPAENMEKVVSMMGGAESLFGNEDIVILKPNLQWHNQGAPNIAAMERLITLVMESEEGFEGRSS